MSEIPNPALQVSIETSKILSAMDRARETVWLPPAAKMLLEEISAKLTAKCAEAALADYFHPAAAWETVKQLCADPSDERILKIVAAAIETPLGKRMDLHREQQRQAEDAPEAVRKRLAAEHEAEKTRVKPLIGFIHTAVSKRREAYNAVKMRYYGQAVPTPPAARRKVRGTFSRASALADQTPLALDADLERLQHIEAAELTDAEDE